jgi:sulfur carrier protein
MRLRKKWAEAHDTPADGAILHGWSRERKAATMGGMETTPPAAGPDATPLAIVLNGSPRTVQAGCSVGGLLDDAGYGERRVAVEVNGEIVPRSAHGQRVLADGDRVEIVQALGGG